MQRLQHIGQQHNAPQDHKLDQFQEKSTMGVDYFINDHRLQNVVEIYNEEMSSTSVSIGYDLQLQKQIAIKKIFKNELKSEYQKVQARRECEVHQSLSHDSIVKVYQYSENENEHILELEFMNDASHFKEKIDDQLRMITREGKMKSYVNDILEGLEYMHSSGYIHCDLKLENLFCQQLEGQILRDVKIGDLGLVHQIDPNTGKAFVEQRCGTLSYIAPEVQNHSYVTDRIDIWSLGIILYKMSCGYKPTQISGYHYGQGPIPFRKFDWRKRSKALQDIIIQMLDMNPEKRPSCKELLSHPWFELE